MNQTATTVGRALTMGQRMKLHAMGVDLRDLNKVLNRTAGPQADPENITIPSDGAQLEEMLGDPARMQKVFANKTAFGEFIRNYAGHVHNQDQTIATQVREETQRVLADYLRENAPEDVRRLDFGSASAVADLAKHLRSPQADARHQLYNPRAMGAVLDKEFDNSAEYFQAIWHQRDKDAQLQAKLARVRNAFSSTVPSEGGFLIPETLRSELLRVALETSVVRSRARIIPMETLRVPFPAVESASNVNSVFGGIVGYWTEEGAALQESSAQFGRIVLDAKKLTAYTQVPNELIADSLGSFQAFIDQIFPEALAWYEDDAFLNGSGVGMPAGLNSASAMISVAAEAGQGAGTIVWENIIRMYARMLPASLGRAVWVASNDVFPELATMALAVGTGGSAIWLNNGVEGPPMTILGRPVIFTEKQPSLGNVGDIGLYDFGQYLIGDRQAMSAKSSEHYKFGNDVTAYRIIERVDGMPWLQSAVTPKNGGPTLSPYVNLGTRP